MLCNAGVNPSRTCIRAILPIWRIRRSSARPLPRASPSGLGGEVIRKFRPPRMRPATSFAATSGLLILLDVGQQLLDAAGPRRSLVVAKVEFRSESQTYALAQKMPDP